MFSWPNITWDIIRNKILYLISGLAHDGIR